MSTAYRQAGRTGLRLSSLGLGCNNFGRRIDQDAAHDVVAAALDAGITHFDTADIYGGGVSEEILGRCLAGHRDQVVVATKFGLRTEPGQYGSGAARKHVIRACEESLRRLGTDHIDVYYLHKPDPETPREETAAAVTQLVEQGKVRYLACSNLPAWQVADLWHLVRRHDQQGLACVQLEWNLLSRAVEADLVPACGDLGIGMVVFSPLASGLLTGKYRRGEQYPRGSRFAEWPGFDYVATGRNLDLVDRVRAFADERGRTLLEVALPWLVARAGVTSVVVGATSAEQLRSNVAAAEREFDAADLASLEDVLVGPDMIQPA